MPITKKADITPEPKQAPEDTSKRLADAVQSVVDAVAAEHGVDASRLISVSVNEHVAKIEYVDEAASDEPHHLATKFVQARY